MKTISEARCEITIERPDGTIEIVCNPQFTSLNPALFSKIAAATKNAGRGTCTGYKNIPAVIEKEDADYKTTCAKCGTKVDMRTAKSAPGKVNGLMCVNHYCDSCNAMYQMHNA